MHIPTLLCRSLWHNARIKGWAYHPYLFTLFFSLRWTVVKQIPRAFFVEVHSSVIISLFPQLSLFKCLKVAFNCKLARAKRRWAMRSLFMEHASDFSDLWSQMFVVNKNCIIKKMLIAIFDLVLVTPHEAWFVFLWGFAYFFHCVRLGGRAIDKKVSGRLNKLSALTFGEP